MKITSGLNKKEILSCFKDKIQGSNSIKYKNLKESKLRGPITHTDLKHYYSPRKA